MNNVPKEVLGVIFSFVPYEVNNWANVLLTCRHWLSIAKPIFLQRMDEITPNHVFIFGGTFSSYAQQKRPAVYNIKNNSWKELGVELDHWREYGGLVRYKSCLYSVGGYFNGGLTKVSKFDLITGLWSTEGDMKLSTPRTLHGTAIIGDTIFVFGGNQKREFPDSYQSVEYWKLGDANQTQWKSASPMPSPNAGFAWGAVGTNILVCGGRSGKDDPYKITWSFDVAANKWISLPNMTVTRCLPCAAVMGSNVMYSIGGYTVNQNYLKSAERLDLRTNRWELISDMNVCRAGAAATSIGGGSLFVAGGWQMSTIMRSTEMYDAKRNTWTGQHDIPYDIYAHCTVNVNLPPSSVLLKE